MNYVQFIINYKSNFIIKNGSASLNPSLIPSLNPSLNETPLARSHPKISPVKCVNGTVKTVNAIHGRGGVISLKFSCVATHDFLDFEATFALHPTYCLPPAVMKPSKGD